MNEGKPVVAIVDDDPRPLESLAELLESAGYATRCFLSAESLLLDGFSGVKLLITDIGMPDLDGFELRDLISRVRPDLPVFLITGRHELADRAQAIGRATLFRKPFDAKALLAAVGEALLDPEGDGRREK